MLPAPDPVEDREPLATRFSFAAERDVGDEAAADLRAALYAWRRQPAGTLVPWLFAACGFALVLLIATWLVARRHDLDLVAASSTFWHQGDGWGVLHVLQRNGLVLVLHAFVCIAGYLAMRSVPSVADEYSGWLGRAHRIAPRVAVVYLTFATIFSLTLQAWALGNTAPMVAAAHGIGVAHLLVLLSPHAVPELVAVFLPLGAWFVLTRRGRYQDLLAASLTCTLFALPILCSAAFIEVYVTPLLIEHATH